MKSEVVQPAFSGGPGVGSLGARSLVTEWEEVSHDGFAGVFRRDAGASWQRAERMFTEYGPVLSVAVVSLMMYAHEAGKLERYLEKLEKHLKDDLHYQHPEARGRVIIAPAQKNRSLLFLESLIYELKPELFD